ncbi:MAG: hypothetical protein HXY34_06750 [Candidatus Thorarchaeota archaeon]|nr:hypothetical protein [Candidatus Thorarchaeota archaeon]
MAELTELRIMAYMFYVMLIPIALILFTFLAFYITSEGSKWQKHRFLGVFARFIQASPKRRFLVFLMLLLLMVPAMLGVLAGFWYDVVMANEVPSNTTPVVNTLLLIFLFAAVMLPVMWSHFRMWRQAVRSAAEVRIKAAQ